MSKLPTLTSGENTDKIVPEAILPTLQAGATPTTVPVSQPAQPKPVAKKAATENFWSDAYGNIWRSLPEPAIVLTVTNDLTVKEFAAILSLLNGK